MSGVGHVSCKVVLRCHRKERVMKCAFQGGFVFAVFAMLGISACNQSNPRELTANSRVPAARGTYHVAKTNNGNTKVSVTVAHLAEPAKISSEATTFMVWAQPTQTGGVAQPLGRLQIGKDLNGSIEVMTPQQNFQLFVTAEVSPDISSPSGDRLLWADIGTVAE